MMRLALIVAVAALASPAVAKDKGPDRMETFHDLAPVTLAPDRAYLLVRLMMPTDGVSYAPIFIRQPGPEELAAYQRAKEKTFAVERPKLLEKRAKVLAERDAALAKGIPFDKPVPPEPNIALFSIEYRDAQNVYLLRYGNSYDKSAHERVLLVSVPPGTYVLAGQGSLITPVSCLCMGTVKLTARGGVITDLGYVLADRADRMKHVSDLPEIAAITKDHDKYNTDVLFHAMAVRPYAAGMPIPVPLQALPREAASYEAFGKMPNYFSPIVMRLAPLPGVLGYEEDRVIDLRTGKDADSAP